MAKSATLFVRLAPEVRQMIIDNAKGPKSLGAFVTAAVESYLNRDSHLVRVVMETIAKQNSTQERLP